MSEIDVHEAQDVAGGLLNLFLFNLYGPMERMPARTDWIEPT